MTRKLAFTALVFLVLTSCSKQEAEKYYPIPHKGASWEYSLEAKQGDTVHKAKMSIHIDSEETINGKTYFKTVTAYSGMPGAEPDIEYERWTSEGIYAIDDKHKDMPEYLSTPFPLTVGKTWTTQAPDTQTQNSAVSIETLQLFDRKYENCLKISYKTQEKGTNIEGSVYLSPGIGMVKTVAKGAQLILEFTLDKYKP